MNPTNKMNKFAVAVIKNKKVMDIFYLEKLGALPKNNFLLLEMRVQ